MTHTPSRHLDMAIVNAQVVTMTSKHGGDAIGVSGHRISQIGAGSDVLAHADSNTRVIDAQGSVAIPGLIDGHAHLDREGLRSIYPDMRGLRTVTAVLDRIKDLVTGLPAGQWVVTMPLGEPPNYHGVQPFPTRQQLDVVAPHNPVFIRPIWGYWRHSQPLQSVLNTRATEAIGWALLEGADWLEMDRDPGTGEFTGLISEWTFEPTLEFLLPSQAGRFTADHRATALRRSMAVYNATGTTGIYEGHGVAAEVEAAYEKVASSTGLSVRARLPRSLPWAEMSPAERAEIRSDHWVRRYEPAAGEPLLRFDGVALGSAHHSLGARARRQARPYTGWAGFDPSAGLEGSDLIHALVACARAGVQVAAMTPDMLDVFEQVDRQVPIRSLRWVLGHINVLSPEDIHRIQRLGLVVTTHTNRYIYKEGAQHEAAAAKTGSVPVPLASLQAAGIPVSLGTDNVPTSLFYPVWHAVARESREGPLQSTSERLSRMEAVRAATMGGAYLTFDETTRGTLAPGMLADLVLLTDDVFATAQENIPDIQAVMTIVHGKVVHDRLEDNPPD